MHEPLAVVVHECCLGADDEWCVIVGAGRGWEEVCRCVVLVGEGVPGGGGVYGSLVAVGAGVVMVVVVVVAGTVVELEVVEDVVVTTVAGLDVEEHPASASSAAAAMVVRIFIFSPPLIKLRQPGL